MAEPSCLKCGNNQFQMTPVDLGSPRHKHSLVHCAQCGSVIGVVDELNVEATLQEARGFIQRQFSALRNRVRPARQRQAPAETHAKSPPAADDTA
jgi:predicted  nucleic acid-binding Zn-ribbon protein